MHFYTTYTRLVVNQKVSPSHSFIQILDKNYSYHQNDGFSRGLSKIWITQVSDQKLSKFWIKDLNFVPYSFHILSDFLFNYAFPYKIHASFVNQKVVNLLLEYLIVCVYCITCQFIVRPLVSLYSRSFTLFCRMIRIYL